MEKRAEISYPKAVKRNFSDPKLFLNDQQNTFEGRSRRKSAIIRQVCGVGYEIAALFFFSFFGHGLEVY